MQRHMKLLFHNINLKFHVFTIIWAILVGIVILLPGGSMPKLLFFDIVGFDKLIHLGSFTVLSLLMIIGFAKQYRNAGYHFNIYYVSIALLLFYAALLEVLQLYVPGRTFEWWDIVSNISGVFLGRLIFFVIYKTT